VQHYTNGFFAGECCRHDHQFVQRKYDSAEDPQSMARYVRTCCAAPHRPRAIKSSMTPGRWIQRPVNGSRFGTNRDSIWAGILS
jgi:hypothetical protein